MRTTEIKVSIGVTLNLGNYQSARIEESETVELEPGEQAEVVSAVVRARVGARVIEEIKKWKPS